MVYKRDLVTFYKIAEHEQSLKMENYTNCIDFIDKHAKLSSWPNASVESFLRGRNNTIPNLLLDFTRLALITS